MPHMSLQSLNLFGHGVEVFSIILLPRGLHSPKSGTAWHRHQRLLVSHPKDTGKEGLTELPKFRTQSRPQWESNHRSSGRRSRLLPTRLPRLEALTQQTCLCWANVGPTFVVTLDQRRTPTLDQRCFAHWAYGGPTVGANHLPTFSQC